MTESVRLPFVADGDRDKSTLRGLVQTIIGQPIHTEFSQWMHLHNAGHGYDRKLKFSEGLARSNRLQGVVGVVDQDRAGKHERRRPLIGARAALRLGGILTPIAIGVADPHVCVWLLDDPAAVRQGLELSSNHAVPNVRKSASPKGTLDQLIQSSRFAKADIREPLTSIAALIDGRRCNHARETGFAAFCDGCRHELGDCVPGA